MKITESYTGKCPQCEVELRHVGDHDECPECYWNPGDEFPACDTCGFVTDDLVEMADGKERCGSCAKEGATV